MHAAWLTRIWENCRWAVALIAASVLSANASEAACLAPDGGLSVSRTVEIDATTGPLFGSVSRQLREPTFLKPKEVVLTFDDGPMPWVTKSILDTLDRFCTKATFFAVGRMALAYPSTVRDVIARGHTLGSHTMSHPFHMPQMNFDAATDEIERGFAAVTVAAGAPVAPFFRFTGLADSARLLGYLQARNMATFTVDVVSNDSYIHDPNALADRTLKEVVRHRGGIILFHDIKTTTAKALPDILARLKAQGFSVVHMTSKPGAEALPSLMTVVAPKLATVRQEKEPMPFYGAIGPEKVQPPRRMELTSVTSPPRERALEPSIPHGDKPIKIAKPEGAPRKPALAKLPQPKAAPPIVASDAFKPSQVELTGPPIVIESDVAAAAPAMPDDGWVTDVKLKPRLKPTRAGP